MEAGRVGRAHGLDGAFHVTGADVRMLEVGAHVVVAGRSTRIERRIGLDSRPVVFLEGIRGREAAEALRGEPLLVDVGDLPVLGEGEYWAHELEGCRVTDGEHEVGQVRRLAALPSCEVLEVQRPGAPDMLVPLVRDAVRSVDVAARRIDVDLGFLGEV